MAAKKPTGKDTVNQPWARWRPASLWKDTSHNIRGPRLEQPVERDEELTNNQFTESMEDLWLCDPDKSRRCSRKNNRMLSAGGRRRGGGALNRIERLVLFYFLLRALQVWWHN